MKLSGKKDIDWWAMELEAEKTYRIEVKGSFSGNGSLKDPRSKLYDSSGSTIVAHNTWCCRDSDNIITSLDTRFTYTVPAGQGGTYYLQVDTPLVRMRAKDDPAAYNLWRSGTYTIYVTEQ